MNCRTCAIVPSFNHWQSLPAIAARLRALHLPVYVIDDGSAEPAASAIAALHDPERSIVVHRRGSNGGKGAAMVDGIRLATAAGYTHALQVDADGQHDLEAVPRLVAAAEQHPHALVSGAPVFDTSVPKNRLIGRWITHFWVFLETMSLRITDSMCGLRVYPLQEVIQLLARERVGMHMEFDSEIMVRLFWRGVPPLMVPVSVSYPPGNHSNFDLLRDNLRISRMHARLVATLLFRMPSILSHRPPRLEVTATHWAKLTERGGLLGLHILALVFRLLGSRACLALMAPVVVYFLITGREQRHASQSFLRRVLGRPVSWYDAFRHYMDFARRALDTVAAWVGDVAPDALTVVNPDLLAHISAERRGCVLVICHHGNAELARALMAPELRSRMTVLLHTRNARRFNRMLRHFRPDFALRSVEVTELAPEIAVSLRERVDSGEWIAIAGDRVPVLSKRHTSRVPFLGELGPFAHGPWLLASLMECPVYLLFCVRSARGTWRLTLEPFAERILLPRGQRSEALAQYAASYAARLEKWCREFPFQWYNFFDLWSAGDHA